MPFLPNRERPPHQLRIEGATISSRVAMAEMQECRLFMCWRILDGYVGFTQEKRINVWSYYHARH